MNDHTFFPQLQEESADPLYLQIREALCDYIERSELQPGDALPSEREMSEIFSVNRLTVRKALEQLIRDGIICQIPGKGTFVEKPKFDQRLLVMTSFTDAIQREGHTPGSRLLDLSGITPRPSIRKALELSKEDQVLQTRRLRLIDDEPFSIAASYIPMEYGRQIRMGDFGEKSLYGLLKECCGLIMSKTQCSLEAVAADAASAEILQISAGAPLFLMTGTTRAQNGIIAEYFRVLYRGDRLRFSTETA